MKKHLLICIALVAVMVSCVKEPTICRRLTPEEAAVIPYHMGEKVNMINQDGDTLCFIVVNDTINTVYGYTENFYRPQNKVIIPSNPMFYMREVVLLETNNTCLLRCKAGYDKVVDLSFEIRPEIYWENAMGSTLSLNQLPTKTVTVGGMTYENVYFDEQTIETASEIIFNACYYNEEYGLIALKHGDMSIQRIP